MAIDRRALLQGYAGRTKINDGGDYLKSGIYEKGLEIRNILIEKKRKGNKFIVEFTVLDSKPTGELDKTGKARVPHAPGSKPSFLVGIDDADGLGLGNMAQFLAALEGIDPKALTEAEIFELALGYSDPDQPGRGMIISDATYNKDTAKGVDFTHHRWEHVVQTEAEVAARRAAQEKKPVAA